MTRALPFNHPVHQDVPFAKLYFFKYEGPGVEPRHPLTVFQDAEMTVAHVQPVLAHESGLFGPIFIPVGTQFAVQMRDFNGTICYSCAPLSYGNESERGEPPQVLGDERKIIYKTLRTFTFEEVNGEVRDHHGYRVSGRFLRLTIKDGDGNLLGQWLDEDRSWRDHIATMLTVIEKRSPREEICYMATFNESNPSSPALVGIGLQEVPR